MKPKSIVGALLLTGMFVVLLTCPGTSIAKGSVTFTAVSFVPKNNVMADPLFIFQERLREASKGTLAIKYRGGPEAIPCFEQIEAVKNGLVDMALLPAAYYVPQIPLVDGVKLSRITPWEERQTGAYNLLNRLHHEKVNAYYLGRFTNGVEFHLYINKRIDKPDFSGLKIRVTPIYKPFVEALGGVVMTTAPGEVYTALERGVVDGYGWPSFRISDFGWHEVTKYVIDPGFYQVDVGIVINLDIWNRLEKDHQDLLISVAKQVEHESSDHFATIKSEERKLIFSKGVQVIRFSGENKEKYLEAAYKAGWEQVCSKCPQMGPEYRKMVEK